MRLTSLLPLTTAAAIAIACGDPADPSVPTTIQVANPALSFSALGETQQIAAAVIDQNGHPIDDPELSWSTGDTSVASVSQDGIVTAIGAGATTVTASSGAASAVIDVQVTQVPARIEKVGGDGQSGLPGQSLGAPLVVQVSDGRGNPVTGASVRFTLTAGDARLASPAATTGPDGRAATALTPAGVGSQQVTASVDATPLSVVFAETAVTDFHIEIRFLTSVTPSQLQAFSQAGERWQSLVVGDVPDAMLNVAAGNCGPQSPAVNEQIDDVVIFVAVVDIDGVGSILGQAGPCFIRGVDGLSMLGLMRLDRDDLENLESRGVLQDVIAHEMGHVLGVGSLWQIRNLLVEPSQSGNADPHFVGPGALQAFDAAGGTTYTEGQKVPVENMGGPGTADVHWREQVFGNELMTGFVNLSGNRLSGVSIASLADLGYVVNVLGADSYSLAAGLRAAGREETIPLGDDVLSVPIGVVGTDGRLVETIRR